MGLFEEIASTATGGAIGGEDSNLLAGKSLDPTQWTVGGNSIAGTTLGGTSVWSPKGVGKVAAAPFEAAVGVDPRDPNAWVTARDRGETIGALYGNYLLPGSSLFTSPMTSKGAQERLYSPGGIGLQLATGGAGLGWGSGTTGIPASLGGTWEQGLFSSGAPSGAPSASASAYDPLAGTGYSSGLADPLADTGYAGGIPAGGVGGTAASTVHGTAAGAAGGMSTAQKIGLGLMGTSLLGGMGGKPGGGGTPSTDPYGTGKHSADIANQIMDQYQKGQLNPADAYAIDKFTKDSIAQTENYYAKAGLSDSSMKTQAISEINAKAAAMKDQALQNMLQSAFQAADISQGPVQNAVQQQIAADQQAQQAQSSFFQTLAMIGTSMSA